MTGNAEFTLDEAKRVYYLYLENEMGVKNTGEESPSLFQKVNYLPAKRNNNCAKNTKSKTNALAVTAINIILLRHICSGVRLPTY